MNNALPISISALGVESAHTLLVSYSLRVQVLDAWSLRPVEGAEVAMLVIDGRHLPCFDLVTDSHGIVQIPIPLGAARAPTFSLKVRFERFAAVAEPSRKEFELGRRMDGRLLAHRAVVGRAARGWRSIGESYGTSRGAVERAARHVNPEIQRGAGIFVHWT
nr:hypothetical protein [Deltaproteobacteria bacterium]